MCDRVRTVEKKMQRHRGIALGLVAGLALLPAAAESQVFKCKDADGKTTYTDVPCLRSETATVVDTRGAANVTDSSSIRKEIPRLQGAELAAPPPPQISSAAPSSAAAPAPAPSPPRRSGY